MNATLLEELKSLSFFKLPYPKTTGPEVFNFDYVESAIQKSKITSLTRQDIIATLTALSADTISDAIRNVMDAGEAFTIYASGGGAHNPVLMARIRENLNALVKLIDELGISGDAKEAVLFAVLANEAIAGRKGFLVKRMAFRGLVWVRFRFQVRFRNELSSICTTLLSSAAE